MKIKTLSQFAIITLIAISFTSCQRIEKLQTSWKYRNDYRVVKQSNIPTQISKVDTNQFHVSNKKELIPFSNTPDNTFALNEIWNKKELKREVKNLIKDYKKNTFNQPQLPSIAVDTPPVSNYYNNGSTGPIIKKIPMQARLSFIFGLTSFVPILGLISAVLAIVFGGLGLYKIETEKKKYRGFGFALAGLLLGIAVLLFYAYLIYSLVILARIY